MSGQSPLSMMRIDDPRMAKRATAGPFPRRRRLRLLVGSIAIVVASAAAWCGLWYYAAAVADRTLAGWVAREAAAGRVYSCGSEGISGFPFSIRTRCVRAAAAFNSNQPPLELAAREITFTAQIDHPTVLTGDITAPLTIGAPGRKPSLVATWSQAQLRVSGIPPDPDAVSITVERPQLRAGAAAGAPTLFTANDAVLRTRIVAGSAEDHPVIDSILRFSSAAAPSIHPLLGEPLQGEVEVVLRGFSDLSPKPLADRFREMAASHGSIEIKSLRFARADATVVGAGSLTLNQQGRLDGVVHIAISGLGSIVPQLGIDKLLGQGIDQLTGAGGQSGQGLAALDRLLPGLSGVVSQSANASVVDDLKKMGQPTQIDNKPATVLPLRFVDGSVYLGILRIGEVPPLF
jgi:hypothetical protein